jgi:hypothetical protein
MTTFARVQAILNGAMSTWRADPGNTPDKDVKLVTKHREPTFPNLDGNFTADDLKNGRARGLPLITAGTPGANTNLIKALRGTLAAVPQMPAGGPYIPDPQIQEIQDWIDAGCPPV